MNERVTSPLLEGDLEGAAYLCLAAAATTDFDQFPPGSGVLIRREHQERKRRFEKAASMVKAGATSLLEFGLIPEDCVWAASKANLVKDNDGWLSRFQTAERELSRIP